MELKKITSENVDFNEAWNIIESSFPEDEKRSLLQQKEIFKKPNYSFMAAYDHKLVGIITLWHVDDFFFVEHFAVKQDLRNRGYGKKILKELEDKYSKIILEIEFPDTELKRRRAGFYEKAALVLNPYPYLQPPYSKSKNPVPCLIMSYPNKITQEEFIEIRKKLHTKVYNLSEPLI